MGRGSVGSLQGAAASAHSTDVWPDPQARGVFTVLDASAYLRINVNEIRRLLKVGELKGWRTLGTRGDWRVSRAAADEWIAVQETRGQR